MHKTKKQREAEIRLWEMLNKRSFAHVPNEPTGFGDSIGVGEGCSKDVRPDI